MQKLYKWLKNVCTCWAGIEILTVYHLKKANFLSGHVEIARE